MYVCNYGFELYPLAFDTAQYMSIVVLYSSSRLAIVCFDTYACTHKCLSTRLFVHNFYSYAIFLLFFFLVTKTSPAVGSQMDTWKGNTMLQYFKFITSYISLTGFVIMILTNRLL